MIIGTCEGELHILDDQLQESKVVAAHQAMITMLNVDNENMVSVGDDMAIRLWAVTKQGNLQYLRQEYFSKRPNLLFTMFGRTLVGFYE